MNLKLLLDWFGHILLRRRLRRGAPGSTDPSHVEPATSTLNRAAPSANEPAFHCNRLQWSVQRTSRTFRVYVVEPREYSPGNHGQLFRAALTSLISPGQALIDQYSKPPMPQTVETFDLVTFPEAFLPGQELVSALFDISAQAITSLGCVHVGLRPSATPDSHLFTVSELRVLIDSLSGVPNIEHADF